MTLYQEFNKWVYQYYMENCIPDSINTLTIPKSVLDNFTLVNQCSFSDFTEIKRFDWSTLNKSREDIPLYFGLIALQCHAAYLMQNDGKITAANYKKPFADLVGLHSANELQSFFDEEIISPVSNKVQEVIWIKAKEHLQKKRFLINIPDIKSHSGRFVQYPIEQVVLNYQDLKEYNQLLKNIYQKHESQVLSFEGFIREIKNEVHKFIKYFKRKNNTNSDSVLSESARHIKWKQIFDYYNSFDWLNEPLTENNKSEGNQTKYFLKVDENDFKMYNQEFNQLSDSEINEVIRKSKFMIFEMNAIYQNEYESVKAFLHENKNILLIYNAPSNYSEIKELDKVYAKVKVASESKNILLYVVDSNKTVPVFLNRLVTTEYPIKLIGYKILGGKKYFSSAPPKIVAKNDTPFVLYFNNTRISLNDFTKVGTYTIKVNGYTNYNFQLIDSPNLEFACSKSETALSFNTLEVVKENEGHMFGLNINQRVKTAENNLSINNWIKALSGQKVHSQNPILKAISQKHYGKNF